MSIEAELRRQITALELNCKKYHQQAVDANNFLDSNKVLKNAVADLKMLERDREVVDAALNALSDLKNLTALPESIQKLVQLLESRT